MSGAAPGRRWRLSRLLPTPPAGDGVRLSPVRQRAFWAVQVLTFVIAFVHSILARNGVPEALYLVPTSLFFIPVVYAALKFGVRGAIPTAIWSTVLAVPDLVLSHEGLDRIGVLWQSAILVAIGAFVGLAVDHERDAREDAEAREAARLASERRYRALYDHAANAVLVIDDHGRIDEANAAAVQLLDQGSRGHARPIARGGRGTRPRPGRPLRACGQPAAVPASQRGRIPRAGPGSGRVAADRGGRRGWLPGDVPRRDAPARAGAGPRRARPTHDRRA